nr:hypothetical protein [Burkholderia lata]
MLPLESAIAPIETLEFCVLDAPTPSATPPLVALARSPSAVPDDVALALLPTAVEHPFCSIYALPSDEGFPGLFRLTKFRLHVESVDAVFPDPPLFAAPDTVVCAVASEEVIAPAAAMTGNMSAHQLLRPRFPIARPFS